MLGTLALLLVIIFGLQVDLAKSVRNSSAETPSAPARAGKRSTRDFRNRRHKSSARRGFALCRRAPQPAATSSSPALPADIQPAMQEDGPKKYRPSSTPTPSMEPVFPKIRKKP